MVTIGWVKIIFDENVWFKLLSLLSKSRTTLKSTCNTISNFLKIPLFWAIIGNRPAHKIRWQAARFFFRQTVLGFSQWHYRQHLVKIWSHLKMSTISSSYKLLDYYRNCHLISFMLIFLFNIICSTILLVAQ
jgi:hypothetical protein